jgi:hypothetical protein
MRFHKGFAKPYLCLSGAQDIEPPVLTIGKERTLNSRSLIPDRCESILRGQNCVEQLEQARVRRGAPGHAEARCGALIPDWIALEHSTWREPTSELQSIDIATSRASSIAHN